MLKETFLNKLKLAFRKLFIDGHSVHDDTLLDKFCTTLEEILCSHSNDDVTRLLEVFENVGWIPALLESYTKLDPRVVAFGLTFVGTMSGSESCHSLLAVYSNKISGFVSDLMTDYANRHASIRCSAMRMLRMVLGSQTADPIFNGINITEVICRGLEDRSIFVQRAAKELTIDYLISSLASGLTVDFRKAHFDRIILWITNLIRGLSSDSDVRVGLIVLEVLLEMSEQKSDEIVLTLCRTTKIRVVAMDTLLSSDDGTVCIACSRLLLAMNAWSFESGVPSQWTVVFEMLLSKRQPMTAAMFLVKTCTKFLDRQRPIPIELKSLLIAPLAIAFDWKANGLDQWSEPSKWDGALEQESNASIKLISFILANIPKLKNSLSNDEKLNLVNCLLLTLLNTNNLLAISSKIQMTITSTLVVSLEELRVTETERSVTVSVKDRVEVWKNVLCTSEQPSSSASVSTQRIQMVRILIKGIDFELQTIWNQEIGDRLNLLLQKRCHDIHWEVRDSAVETIGEIIKRSREHAFLQTWCVHSGLLRIAMANLDDSESYVRASTLQVLSYTSSIPNLRDEVAKVVMLESIMSILLTDDEGVTRRAAAKALFSLSDTLIRDASLDEQVAETFLIASSDLDWEVKLTCIEFWQQIFDNSTLGNLKGQAGNQLEYLSRIGFNDALMLGAIDQDLSVRHKAAAMMHTLKQLPVMNGRLSLGGSKEVKGEELTIENDETKQGPEENVDLMSDQDKYEAIESILDTIDSDIVAAAMVPRRPTIASSKSELQKLIAEHHHFHRERTSEQKFLFWLSNFNLEQLSERNNSTTDVYKCDPEALLDDLLAVNRETDDEDEEIALDCY